MAAVLACGEGAVLSHESAATLWSVSPTCPPFVHVTVPGDAGRARRQRHRPSPLETLAERDATLRHSIPVTTHERTLADIGWPRADPQRPRAPVPAACPQPPDPNPEVNAKVGPYTVDFLWRTQRLVVETDGYEFHSSPSVVRIGPRTRSLPHSRGYRPALHREVTNERHRRSLP